MFNLRYRLRTSVVGC